MSIRPDIRQMEADARQLVASAATPGKAAALWWDETLWSLNRDARTHTVNLTLAEEVLQRRHLLVPGLRHKLEVFNQVLTQEVNQTLEKYEREVVLKVESPRPRTERSSIPNGFDFSFDLYPAVLQAGLPTEPLKCYWPLYTVMTVRPHAVVVHHLLRSSVKELEFVECFKRETVWSS